MATIVIERLFYNHRYMANRDEGYLAKLRDYYAIHRILPSFTCIAKIVGLRSTSAVAAMVDRMKEQEFLDSAFGGRLRPGRRFFEREISDSIQAGLPQSANGLIADEQFIDAYLISSPSRTVLLQVKSDSMIDAGLLPSDVVVVEKGAPATPDDIVVAIVDGEYTIKYLAKDEKGFYLRPGNKLYSEVRATESLELFGVVTGQFRRYGK